MFQRFFLVDVDFTYVGRLLSSGAREDADVTMSPGGFCDVPFDVTVVCVCVYLGLRPAGRDVT